MKHPLKEATMATARSMAMDRCDLCKAQIAPTARGRIGHLRRSHPGYARGLLLRVVAPGVFLMAMMVLGATHAPGWVYLAALFGCFGLLFWGKQRSRNERRREGVRPTLPFVRLIREGGWSFLLVLPILAAVIVLLGR
jgi:hypothetical protein